MGLGLSQIRGGCGLENNPVNCKTYLLPNTFTICVQTTEAAARVVGFERRDGYIRSRAEHRAKLSKFRTKGDMSDLIMKQCD